MMTSITSWLRAFFSVRERAGDVRGLEEVDAGTSERRAWPRTTGSDVVAITSVVDPAVRVYPLRYGGHGLGRRWRVCLEDVARYAIPSPLDEYAKNPSFWSAIGAMSVFLHSVAAPLPDAATWSALLDQLGNPASSRDGGTMSTLTNWTQAYLELKARAEKVRGTVVIDDGGDSARWPCTTGADVIAIAALFYGYVNAIEPEAAGGAAVARRWRETMTQVERSALASPDHAFVDNNMFWMTLASLCVFLESVNAQLPDRGLWTALLDQIGKPATSEAASKLEAGARKLGELVGDAARGVGKAGNEVGQALISGLGTPLLIGAAMIRLLAISRRNRQPED